MSGLVVRMGMPVPDDLRQALMFGGDDGSDRTPSQLALIHLLEDVVEVAKASMAMNNALMQKLETQTPRRNGTPRPAPKPKRPYVPQEREYRQWATFRDAFVRLERNARRDKHLPPQVMVTPDMVHDVGGPHPRTVERILTRTYGLSPRLWPPSSWPETL